VPVALHQIEVARFIHGDVPHLAQIGLQRWHTVFLPLAVAANVRMIPSVVTLRMRPWVGGPSAMYRFPTLSTAMPEGRKSSARCADHRLRHPLTPIIPAAVRAIPSAVINRTRLPFVSAI